MGNLASSEASSEHILPQQERKGEDIMTRPIVQQLIKFESLIEAQELVQFWDETAETIHRSYTDALHEHDVTSINHYVDRLYLHLKSTGRKITRTKVYRNT